MELVGVLLAFALLAVAIATPCLSLAAFIGQRSLRRRLQALEAELAALRAGAPPSPSPATSGLPRPRRRVSPTPEPAPAPGARPAGPAHRLARPSGPASAEAAPAGAAQVRAVARRRRASSSA
jgi:hypothetical protein